MKRAWWVEWESKRGLGFDTRSLVVLVGVWFGVRGSQVRRPLLPRRGACVKCLDAYS